MYTSYFFVHDGLIKRCCGKEMLEANLVSVRANKALICHGIKQHFEAVNWLTMRRVRKRIGKVISILENS